MTISGTEAGLTLIVFFLAGWLAGWAYTTIYIKALERAARQAISAVHDFAGFMDGYACGPAESEMVSRCLPLARLIEYDIGEDEP